MKWFVFWLICVTGFMIILKETDTFYPLLGGVLFLFFIFLAIGGISFLLGNDEERLESIEKKIDDINKKI